MLYSFVQGPLEHIGFVKHGTVMEETDLKNLVMSHYLTFLFLAKSKRIQFPSRCIDLEQSTMERRFLFIWTYSFSRAPVAILIL